TDARNQRCRLHRHDAACGAQPVRAAGRRHPRDRAQGSDRGTRSFDGRPCLHYLGRAGRQDRRGSCRRRAALAQGAARDGARMAAEWLVKPSNFFSDDDSGLGLRIFEALVYGGALDSNGVVTFPSWKLNFTVLTGLFPVSVEDLLVPDITEKEAVEAYQALIAA